MSKTIEAVTNENRTVRAGLRVRLQDTGGGFFLVTFYFDQTSGVWTSTAPMSIFLQADQFKVLKPETVTTQRDFTRAELDELHRLRGYYVSRIVFGVIGHDGLFSCAAVHTMHRPDSLLRQGLHVFVLHPKE